MDFQIEGNPDYGHLVVSLGPGDKSSSLKAARWRGCRTASM